MADFRDLPALSPKSLGHFSHNGVIYHQRTGLGAVPDVANIAHMGFVVMMRPSVYLDLCPPLKLEFNGMEAKLRAGEPIGMPFLAINLEDEEVRIRSHEGRHRALCVRSITNDAEMPVAVLLARGDRARHVRMENVARMASGARRQRSTQEPNPPFIDGPLFERVILNGREVDLASFAPVLRM
ncbi:hypothetical protein [Bosea sp. ANAM02]|uniref:hypothetical protein n=1 Tax=Bosea sp. ANAM02 TaxID=2020412 RepID=UPI00140F3C89|nr:hypothetical protein [Bosea sp. ANAM02]BCB22556.1 hypothetical protein OCUBac02_54500 [Bosea sp. ANAM02]